MTRNDTSGCDEVVDSMANCVSRPAVRRGRERRTRSRVSARPAGSLITPPHVRRLNAHAAPLVLEMALRTPKAGEKYFQDQLRRRQTRALRSKHARRRAVQEVIRVLERHVRDGLFFLVHSCPIGHEKLFSRWREEWALVMGPAVALLDAERIAQWKEQLSVEREEYRRFFDPDEIARQREVLSYAQIGTTLRYKARATLHVSPRDDVDVLAPAIRSIFDSIPSSALAISPTASTREALRRALDIFTAIVGLAILDGRSDLVPFFFALHAGTCAMDERNRGIDEPLLRSHPRSSNMPRESMYAQHVKAYSAMACATLISLGVQRQDAARQAFARVSHRKNR